MTSFGGKISPDGGILSPYARVRIMTSLPCVRTQRHLHTQKLLTFFGGKNIAIWGDTLPVRTRTMTSLPCVRTQRHLHAQKLLTSFWREKFRYIGGYSLRTHAYARMTSFSRRVTSLPALYYYYYY